MTTISDDRLREQLEHARRALVWTEANGLPIPSVNIVDNALKAAIEALRQQSPALPDGGEAGVRVKPLEWEPVTETTYGELRRYWKAPAVQGGFLWINVHTADFEGECSCGGQRFQTASLAKASVEAHHASQIMRFLEHSPVPGGEGEPVTWQYRYWYSSGEPGVWLNERRADADDMLESGILVREDKRPLYARPTTDTKGAEAE